MFSGAYVYICLIISEKQAQLGRKNILNTMIYINLEQAIFEKSDGYIVKRPKTTQEEDKLKSVGFEYVRFDDKENTPVYRKKKRLKFNPTKQKRFGTPQKSKVFYSL